MKINGKRPGAGSSLIRNNFVLERLRAADPGSEALFKMLLNVGGTGMLLNFSAYFQGYD
jgi:hypothetical protein